ncbi:hypothetical protein [Photobacterium leiognathi]|uniref:hypothetical protein n=1 Tax=Photobacterium leiognathi TaxID=553611 RepID=UPI00298234A1|nr:hypothetical protein [Photobacterium leiognathi]
MLKQVLVSATVSFLLAGCASGPSFESRYDQVMIGNKQTPDDYSYIDKSSLSDEMRFMYYIGDPDVKPIKSNNLDRYAKNYNPHAVSDAALIGGSVLTLLGGANIFQLGTFGLGNFGGRKHMDLQYQESKIIVLVPTDGLDESQIKSKLQASVAQTTLAVRQAIEGAGKYFLEDKYFTESGEYDIAYFIANNENGKTPECVVQGELNSYGRIGSNYFCSSALQMLRAQYRTKLTDNRYLPDSDFIAYDVVLEPGFPIEKLSMNSEFSYLYVAPFGEYRELRVESYNRTQEQWKKIYMSGRLSMFPYIKNLKTGNIHYFNKKISALQEDIKTPII